MARVTSSSSRRRVWLPLVLILFFIVWYRNTKSVSYSPPRWDVVDFQIKESRERDRSLDDESETWFDHNGAHFGDPSHSHSHGHSRQHLKNQYEAAIDAIRARPAFQQHQISYDELQDKIAHFIQWERPSTDHWPSWHDYDDKDYDPNRWEALDRYEACEIS